MMFCNLNNTFHELNGDSLKVLWMLTDIDFVCITHKITYGNDKYD